MLLIGNIIKQIALSLEAFQYLQMKWCFPLQKKEESAEDIYQKESEVRIQLIAAGKQGKWTHVLSKLPFD